MISTRDELTNASAFQAAWDTTMAARQPTSLPGFPDSCELDPNNVWNRIAQLNDGVMSASPNGRLHRWRSQRRFR